MVRGLAAFASRKLGVAANTDVHGQGAANGFGRRLNDHLLLVGFHCRALAGRAQHDEAAHAGGGVVPDQLLQGLDVDLAVMERGHQRQVDAQRPACDCAAGRSLYGIRRPTRERSACGTSGWNRGEAVVKWLTAPLRPAQQRRGMPSR